MYIADAKRLTHEGARKMMATAIDKAREAKLAISCCITDAGGHVIVLERMDGGKSPFEAFERFLGVSETSAKTLAAAAWVLGDPRSQAILDEMAKARLRAAPGGASVLADTPVR